MKLMQKTRRLGLQSVQAGVSESGPESKKAAVETAAFFSLA
jgi:hypothetical protein